MGSVPQGIHNAICIGVIDMGTQKSFQNKEQKKVALLWEIHVNNQIKNFSREYTFSYYKNAALRLHLESWRGRPFTKDELSKFKLRNIIGVPCKLEIRKNSKNLKQVENIYRLSIAFGVGIWGAFVAVAVTISAKNLSTITMSMVVLIALIAMYVIFTFSALFIYSQLYRLLPKNKNCDFIIVHGAGLLNGERVSPLLAGRLNKGIEVFESSGRKAKIIVSGGQGSDENISEAEAMKNYLFEKGISEHDIIMEDRSTTTLENMMFSKKIMDQIMPQYRVIFVTNDYHVFRTGLYAKQVGLKADGVGCKTASYYWPNAFIREYIAIILKYKAVPIILFLLWLAGTVMDIATSCIPKRCPFSGFL